MLWEFISLKFTVCYTFSLHFITASIKFANDSTVWSLILLSDFCYFLIA